MFLNKRKSKTEMGVWTYHQLTCDRQPLGWREWDPENNVLIIIWGNVRSFFSFFFLSFLDPKNKGCLLVQGHCAMLSFLKYSDTDL